jgi:hypothetical protein
VAQSRCLAEKSGDGDRRRALREYLEEWSTDVVSRRVAKLSASVTVTGIWDRHAGPKLEFAKIRLKAEPAERFDVDAGRLKDARGLERDGFLTAAIFGLLDVLLTTASYPLTNLRVIFTEAEAHPINSSQMAFRMAGRDAGHKLIDQHRKHLSVTLGGDFGRRRQ